MAKNKCDCPGAGHDPAVCASAAGKCRVLHGVVGEGGTRICGLPEGHDSELSPEEVVHGKPGNQWVVRGDNWHRVNR